jgi:hypothetical protein
VLVVGVTTACRPDTVEIAYRFEEGQTISYRITGRAEARWDIGEPGAGSYEVGFEVEETVRSADGDGAVVDVEMIPIPESTREEGLPSPGLERRSFSLLLGPNGEVVEVLQLDGIAASVLDQDQLAFIGTYRPPLPPGETRLRDEWSDERRIRVGSTVRQIDTTGTLVGFGRDGDRRLARIEFTGRGPLEWVTTLPQGEAQLIGDAATNGTGLFDIDGGTIVEATSSTSGDFEVRVLPPGGRAPITGLLHLDLRLEVERLG